MNAVQEIIKNLENGIIIKDKDDGSETWEYDAEATSKLMMLAAVTMTCMISHQEKQGRLVAAAPDLLEALKIAIEVMEAVDGENDCRRGTKAAYAAIAKAEGN